MGQRESIFGGCNHGGRLCSIYIGINTELSESGSKDPITWDKGFNWKAANDSVDVYCVVSCSKKQLFLKIVQPLRTFRKGSGLHTTQHFSEIESRPINVNDAYGGCNIGLPVSGFELRVKKRELIYLAVK